MKSIFTLAALLFSFAVFAQNYTIKGKVQDTNGMPIVGATLRANVSKVSVVTDKKGEYSIEVTPDDRTLRMMAPNMEGVSKRISKDVVGHSFDFEVFALGGRGRGKMSSDMKTYYTGENDNTFYKMIDGHFSNCSLEGGYVVIRTERCTYYEVDGAPIDNLFSVDPLTVYSITILKDLADCVIYGGRAMRGAVIIKTKIGQNKNNGVKVQVSSSVSTGI